ncbi:MAG TPA: metallopeptidase TldD-related protein [Terriglobales bacterium]|nr:metallopeptidase TldD-related protein [Terriglobales bacterium]
MKFRVVLASFVVLLSLWPAAAGEAVPKGDVLLATMQQELERATAALSQADPKPYFVSYSAFDQEQFAIVAVHGALITSVSLHRRMGNVSMRIGSTALDNTHGAHRGSGLSSEALPLGNDQNAIARTLWRLTDREYHRAAEAYLNAKTSTVVRAREEDDSPDFSPATPSRHLGDGGRQFAVDRRAWEDRLRRLSGRFRSHPEIYTSVAMLGVESGNEYFVSTEGSAVVSPHYVVRLLFEAVTRAEDGMELFRAESFQARSLDRLPDETRLAAAIDSMAADLEKLRAAPVAEPFDGPALLSGRASAVFFHEVLGHRLEGQRQRGDEEGQTFTKKVHQQVLPAFLSVVDDPTLRELGGAELSGWYEYDQEGVAAARVPVIQAGVLQDFLMSRMPIRNFAQSNGHGRADETHMPVGRQGNLIVTSTRTATEAELRQKLIDEIKRQGKPYGLYFQDIQGGFTLTTRALPQTFQVLPVLVWKVYADGRPDELVRGVDIVGTPLAALEHILVTGRIPEVFNGICGAESGRVPVSAAAPALLFSEIEVQRRSKSNNRPPILPPPGFETRKESPQ